MNLRRTDRNSNPDPAAVATKPNASPYEGLPERAFWRTAVANRGPGRLRGLYTPRFPIDAQTPILTAGSCFAQHVHHALKDAGFHVIETEPPPAGIDPDVAKRYFYGTFSARYGNIYNPRQFLQLIQEAAGLRSPTASVWERAGRFYDAHRPNVDPGGWASAEAVSAARQEHLAHVAEAIGQAGVVILTLGLHETWQERTSGTVYPTAPGIIADPPPEADIGFLSLSHDAIVADTRAALDLLRDINPDLKLILTVAPGPLVATAGGGHVLVASTAGKAILRAAVETLIAADSGIDYFPSYEIITNPAARGALYQPNLRHPTPKGISVVMKQFLGAHLGTLPPERPTPPTPTDTPEEGEAICEEMLNDPQMLSKAPRV